MNERDFDEAKQLLEQRGFAVCDSSYDPTAFGSWFVYVDGSPRFGIVWDGKDQWLIVRQETEQSFGKARVWDDLWVGRDPSDHVVSTAVAKLVDAAVDGST